MKNPKTGRLLVFAFALLASLTLSAQNIAPTNSLAVSTNPPAKSKSDSRFSDQPAPLALEGFPERPKPLLEIGDKLLGPGNIPRGFDLPGGAHWTPSFWLFGDFRTAIQSFDPGRAPRVSEWANRLDLYGNLQLAGQERILIGFRPLDRYENGEQRYSGYNFEPANPSKYHGWQGHSSATPTTFFFEGELGEILPNLTKGDKHNLEYGFSVGRQPLVLQEGLLVNDDIIDLIGITQNTLQFPGASIWRLTGLFAWSEVDRANNREDKDAYLFGVDSTADFNWGTIDATALYVTSDNGGDGFYTGLGVRRRFGKYNTLVRVANSVAVEEENDRVRNGTLLLAQTSFIPEGSRNLVYMDAFWGIDEFSSADRSPTAAGPLGRVGLLNEASSLGRYGTPLTSYSDNSVGGSLGYQMFFGAIPRAQLTMEVGGRVPTRKPITEDQFAAGGVAARWQKAYGRRHVMVLDAFAVVRERNTFSSGVRAEWHIKF